MIQKQVFETNRINFMFYLFLTLADDCNWLHNIIFFSFRNKITDRGFTELAAAMAASADLDIKLAVKSRSTIQRSRKLLLFQLLYSKIPLNTFMNKRRFIRPQ